MLKIRLARIGRKNDPSFRVVVTEHTRGPKSGNHIEILGNYNPKMDNVSINGERVKHWISNGAQVSDTVHNILVGQGIIEGKKINVLPKKSPIIKEADETKEEAPVAESTGAEAAAESSAAESTDEVPSKDGATDGEESKEEAPAEEVKDEAPAEKKS